MSELDYANPFYHNYVFTKFDQQRHTISRWQRLTLWFLPTYVQLNEGYEFYFKRGWDGRIYLMDVKAFRP